MEVLIATANNGLPYVEVSMSFIHNHNFLIYFTVTRYQKASFIIPPAGNNIINNKIGGNMFRNAKANLFLSLVPYLINSVPINGKIKL